VDPLREHGGCSLTTDSVGRISFEGMGLEYSVGGCLHRGPNGELGEVVHLQGTVRDSGRMAPEMEHLSLREL
jgi:hypothetical protein